MKRHIELLMMVRQNLQLSSPEPSHSGLFPDIFKKRDRNSFEAGFPQLVVELNAGRNQWIEQIATPFISRLSNQGWEVIGPLSGIGVGRRVIKLLQTPVSWAHVLRLHQQIVIIQDPVFGAIHKIRKEKQAFQDQMAHSFAL